MPYSAQWYYTKPKSCFVWASSALLQLQQPGNLQLVTFCYSTLWEKKSIVVHFLRRYWHTDLDVDFFYIKMGFCQQNVRSVIMLLQLWVPFIIDVSWIEQKWNSKFLSKHRPSDGQKWKSFEIHSFITGPSWVKTDFFNLLNSVFTQEDPAS